VQEVRHFPPTVQDQPAIFHISSVKVSYLLQISSLFRTDQLSYFSRSSQLFALKMTRLQHYSSCTEITKSIYDSSCVTPPGWPISTLPAVYIHHICVHPLTGCKEEATPLPLSCSIIELFQYVRGLCCHIFRQEVQFTNVHVARFAFSCSNLSHPRFRHLSTGQHSTVTWSTVGPGHQLSGRLSGTCGLHLIGLMFDSLVPVVAEVFPSHAGP